MLREIVVNLQSIFVSPSEVEAFRHMVPTIVTIKYKIEHGTYIAFIEYLDDIKVQGLLITEGSNEEEVNRNLNQLIYMNSKVPEKVRPYYGNMFNFKINKNVAKSGELVFARA